MKKILLSIMLVAIGQMSIAQVVQENEAAVVYYMPKNELSITLEYDVVHQTPGIFYQYASRYLGTKDVVTDAKTTYVLTDVKSELITGADTNRAFKVIASQDVKEQLITLSDDGRLLGYNVGLDNAPLQAVSEKQEMRGEREAKSDGYAGLMPLLEEQFMATSTAKMAEGAAKQIYRIRETRLNLLAGEVEHVPADGEAMKQVLAELDKQEQALAELFIGKTVVRHASKTLIYEPRGNVNKEMVCRFSLHNGVVAADDLSGEPVYLSIKAEKQTLQENILQGSKVPAISQLYYNLPGRADLSLVYKDTQYVQATYQIAQFGVAIPIAKQLFASRRTPVIHINPQTGNILSIQ